MQLHSFRYRYAAGGEKEGLDSVSFEFRPFDADTVTAHDEMKRITRENFELLRGVYDNLLLNKPFRCKCRPDFSDSESASRGGYVYQGQLGGALSANSVFLYATVHFTLSKTLDGQISIEAHLSLNNDGNITGMDSILALPGITITPTAQRRIDDLRKLLAEEGDADAKVTGLLNSDTGG